MNKQELIRLIKEQEENETIRQELIRRKRNNDIKLAKTDYLKYLMVTHNYLYKFDQYKHAVLAANTLERVNIGEINRLMIYSPPNDRDWETIKYFR